LDTYGKQEENYTTSMAKTFKDVVAAEEEEVKENILLLPRFGQPSLGFPIRSRVTVSTDLCSSLRR
jgi:hypothetical protein